MDLSDLISAINIRLNSPTPKLSSIDLARIRTLKAGMNKGREVIDNGKLENMARNFSISRYWLLGFTVYVYKEGVQIEGSPPLPPFSSYGDET